MLEQVSARGGVGAGHDDSPLLGLAAAAHHEVRSPLGLISTVAQQALLESDIGRLRSWLELIDRSARRALRTADELLDIAPRSDTAATDVPAIVSEIVRDLSQVHEVALAVDESASPAAAWDAQIRASTLELILQSLFANAIDHHEPGTPIEVRMGRTEDAVVLTIRNTIARRDTHRGAGMGSRIVEHLCAVAKCRLTRTAQDGVYEVTLALPTTSGLRVVEPAER